MKKPASKGAAMKKPASVAPIEDAEEADEEEEGEAEAPVVMKKPASKGAVASKGAAASKGSAASKGATMMKTPASKGAAVSKGAAMMKKRTSKGAVLKKPAAAAAAMDTSEPEAPAVMKKPSSPSQGANTAVLKRPAAASEAPAEEPASKKANVLKKPAAADAPAVAQPPAPEEPQDEETLAANRRKELKALLAIDLREIVVAKGLEKGTKEAMLEEVLAQEAKEREAVRAAKARRIEVTAMKKAEFDARTLQDLKQLCGSKGLKLGGTKADKVERLMAFVQEAGEIDATLASMARAARRKELGDMSKETLHALCVRAGIDPFMKEVMIERIMAHDTGLRL